MLDQNTADVTLQNSASNALALMPSAGQPSDAVPQYSLSSSRVPVSLLNQKHVTWTTYCDTWEDLAILFVGGTVLRQKASRVLTEKPHEIKEIFAKRIEMVTYQNVFGSVCGWYLAKVFAREPEIDIKRKGVTLQAPDRAKNEKPDATWQYYDDFLDDCDRNGTNFIDFAKEVFRQVLHLRKSYVVIDLPREVQEAANRRDQSQLILPYLCSFDRRSAYNWQNDEYGVLEWIVFHTELVENDFLRGPQTVHRWFYYDRQEFRIYESREDDTRMGSQREEFAKVIARGPHATADYENADGSVGRVPVIEVEVPDVLDFGQRVYLQVLDHFNLENTLKWGLFLGNLAMPVIKTAGEYEPTLSESGFIKLRPGDEFSWAEPGGHTFTLSGTRLAEIREEIYRSMYAISQGRSSSATASASSGLSKQLDGAPAEDVVNAFGRILRVFMQLALNVIAKVRGDDVIADVRGLDTPEDEEVIADVATGQEILALNMPSDLFRKEVQKSLIRSYGRQWNDEVVKECCEEIDESLSPEEQQAEDAKQQAQQAPGEPGKPGAPASSLSAATQQAAQSLGEESAVLLLRGRL